VLSSFGQGVGFIPSFIGGVNFTNFKSEQFESSSKPGFVLGFNFTAQTGDKLDIITEFTFATKKINTTAREYDDISASFSDSPYDVKFITFGWALLANYYIKAPNFSLQAGPMAAYNYLPATSLPVANIYYGTSNVLSENIYGNDLISNMSGLDYGLIMGISGGTEALRVNLRYHLGLKNYYKDISINGYIVKSNYIELTIAYSFLNARVE